MKILPRKEQFVVTHRYTIVQETKKNFDRSLIGQHLSTSYFYEYIIRIIFCGYVIFIGGVFFTQLSSIAEKLCGLREIALS